MKNIIIAVLGLIIVFGGIYFVTRDNEVKYSAEPKEEVKVENEDVPEVEKLPTPGFTVKEKSEVDETKTVIGKSEGGSDITAFHYGSGNTELLFVGGIHGGYAWNTVLVARQMMNYLEKNPDVIPEDIKVTIIPVLNPDGLEETVGTYGNFSESDVPTLQEEVIAGRFNSNGVDLNRNFDCAWQSDGKWKGTTVSGGDVAFSESESKALQNYVNTNNPEAVVAWYTSAGGVFASSCSSDVLEETSEIMNVYADASGYKAYEKFDFYEVTGDMVNWLAKEGVPAISVLLTAQDSVEWDKNKMGMEALLKYYSQ